MAPILNYKEIRAILIRDAAWRRKTITFAEVENALGKSIQRDRWMRILDPMASMETRLTGYDLTKVLVYASGPAKALPLFFSNIRAGDQPGSKRLNPKDRNAVAACKRELEQLYDAYKDVKL